MPEGPYARITAIAAILGLILSYLSLAAVVKWAPFESASSQAAAMNSPASNPAVASSPTTGTGVIVTGEYGRAPNVHIPDVSPPGNLVVQTEIQGNGPSVRTTDALVGNCVMYTWSGNTLKLIGSIYSSGGPTLFTGTLLPGLKTALTGQELGSRILAVLPPQYAYGSSGNSSIGVSPTDTLVFVVDLIAKIRRHRVRFGRAGF